ncbi:MAG: hypothetical protein IJ180_09450 [Bacteroidales bacterium]|nr:hypothetical protein [Bacteroidales bacterium]
MNTENLTGKYFGAVTKWDNSVMNLDFEDSLEQKRIYKVMGEYKSEEPTEETWYYVKEIRFHNHSITLWNTSVYTECDLKKIFTELTQEHVEELKNRVMNNIFNNL